jgi:hypothetical protein
MQSASFYSLGLLLHIVGLFLIAGGSVGSLVVERLLWQHVGQGKIGLASGLLPLLRQLPVVIQIGSFSMPLSGLLMLQQVQWSYWGQLWLTGKLMLYVLLVLNGILVAKPAGERLAQTLSGMTAPLLAGLKDAPAPPDAALPAIRQRMLVFTLTQFGMLLLLLVLSTFKPV